MDNVYTKRKYKVTSVEQAKSICTLWLSAIGIIDTVKFGLPEVDDRYHIWRIPLRNKSNSSKIGEVVVDAFTTLIDGSKTTKQDILKKRLLEIGLPMSKRGNNLAEKYEVSLQRNTVAMGDSESVLHDMAAKSVDLIFTSPPYFNARPEYSDYITYEEYLLKMRKIIQACHKVLNEGRFFVMNIAPVLLRRPSRSEASKRIAVPFDIHRIFIEEGFDFVDDIIWVKPEGAGWATGRGRRFAADRTPLQYKAVPVTEYVLVYRKHTDKLIDWNIRAYPNQSIVKGSKLHDKYEATNVWKITPAHNKSHPAIFPQELAEKVISYYSFKSDVVLDPFAGIGTVGAAASKLGRRFVLIEIDKKYVDIIRKNVKTWVGDHLPEVLFINCEPPHEFQKSLL